MNRQKKKVLNKILFYYLIDQLLNLKHKNIFT